MQFIPSCNVFGYIDWTTGLLLSDNSSEVYPEQQQSPHQHHQSLQSPTAFALSPGIAISRPPTELPSHPKLQPQQGPVTSPSLSLPLTPIVQLTNTSTHCTPSYTLAPTTEIVINRSGSSYPLQQDSVAGPNFLSLFGEPSNNTDHRACNYNYRFPFSHQSGVSDAPPNHVGCSSLFSTPIPAGSSHQSYSSAVMTSRTQSKGKERLSNKRGTSVMSEPTEDFGSRSCKFQRSHSSSLVDYEDLQSTYLREVSRDDDEQEDARMLTPSPTPSDEPRGSRGGRQNHSEIEKRRRDKMNTYITELSRVVPMCITMSHKLDKLTVLRMAVQHLKTIRGAIHSYSEGDYKPSFLSDEELKRLILQSADGFLFVVGCDRGRMLYVSESVSQVLNYSQGDLLGQSWFDILHPKDVAKVKEQLSSSDLSPRERLIDAKTMLPVKTDVPQGLSRLCPGARRSFFCRMKCRAFQSTKDTSEATGTLSSKHRKTQNVSKEKRYVVVHCTGYLKSWAPAKIGVHDQDAEGDVEACNLSCLVAVGRIPTPNIQNCASSSSPFAKKRAVNESSLQRRSLNFEFISRHTIDGKFVFVDQRATLLLGLLPQELLGTSMYEYYHADDIVALTEVHKSALQATESVTTAIYRFRVKEGTFVRLQSRWKSFRNPWTKDIEFLVAKNAYIDVECDAISPCNDSAAANFSNNDVFYQGTGTGGTQTASRVRLFSMEVEASKIGQTVADEVLDFHRSRSRSSTSAISSSAVRSPGSVLSCSATASPFSNVGSPLDPEPNYLATGALPSSFPNEEVRRHPVSVGGSSSAQPTVATGSTMNTPRNLESVAATVAVQVNSNGSGSNSSGSNSGLRGLNNHHNLNNNHNHAKTRNNAQLLHILNEAGLHADEDMMEVIGGLMMDQSQSSSRENSSPADGNDEAAMAVVMSLLEADAGLGGPVDFSGLPWPLP
ncbi:Aryl hydrocarbon receptor nuclear translocator protein 1 [Daphnia magna]|uniref:Aryl hydrocarbon receptor nuclear translocator protein 1 n=1 Tax=Daphnia magna TaxID=35525 RepID=A0A164KXJ8_9CRUS|nr:Aryl hydrocarbon receptor nuclear translocator protein 1 [Daphnia magna]